jgi:hypothetical protein
MSAVMAKNMKISVVAELDLGSGAYLTPGSGISFSRIPDIKFQLPNPCFTELSNIFLGLKIL